MTRERTLRSLRLNGRPVRVVGNQMIEEFFDFDVGEPPKPKKARPKCVCGAQAAGYKPYMAGHSKWCDVHEDKTPVGVDNPLYEKDNGST